MKVITIGPEINDLRRSFFEEIFGEQTGYIALASKAGEKFHEAFFSYPDQMNKLLEYINLHQSSRDMYFCPQLFDEEIRRKEFVKVCTCLWSDLDECDPRLLDPAPSILIKTSPGRHQALWLLQEPAEPFEAEDGSHRIAHRYANFGADKSGWDLTQLLRIPVTYNLKYEVGTGSPVVEITDAPGTTYPLSQFLDNYEPAPGTYIEIEDFPKELLTLHPGDIFDRYKGKLSPLILDLYEDEPTGDWSAALWRLENLLLEHGVSKEETFVVCWGAACNKYKRDKRPPEDLWKDVCKAESRFQAEHSEDLNKPLAPLLTAEERVTIADYESFADRYVKWCRTRGDAAWEYHEAGAFTILSALLGGAIKLRTSFGTIIPNLWFLILGDTTLSRKSTAMDMAMELLREIEDDAILATDGSVEGLMSAISTRPGKPGIFWKDEFSGFLEAITKKDYMAGMAETLTKLYDGKYQKRQLRKEIIEIKDPVLILLCGGIRSRIYELLSVDHVSSGFLPRFIFVMADTDIANYQPMGPMSSEQDDTQSTLRGELTDLKDTYIRDMTMHIGTQEVNLPATFDVVLTQDAWDRYNKFEHQMVMAGTEAATPDFHTPTFDRLSKSGLKVALLLAASRQEPNHKNQITVELNDILKAIDYIERWREHSVQIIRNVGRTTTEKRIDQVWSAIRKNPMGISRGTLMQNTRLTSREADWILETLEQRNLIKRKKAGRGESIEPIVHKKRVTGTKPRKKK